MRRLHTLHQRRYGSAAVEFAVTLPFLFLILFGLWEVGRITEVQNVTWNSAREAARDASLGQDGLQTVASNLLMYLQGAEPTAFGKGHATSIIAPVITLPPNTYGYTVWDTTANKELFTMTFTDLTDPTVTDPTNMAQLDLYRITVQVPYASVGLIPTASTTGTTRMVTTVVWASMLDSPFEVAPFLPAD
ncbi:MAG: TadE/TadG family type IV pilus assembly protein [Gemmataceae bacterium]